MQKTSTPLILRVHVQLVEMECRGPLYIIQPRTKRPQHTVGRETDLSLVATLTTTLAITLHNLAFQARVMGHARDSIMDGTFPAYLRRFFADYFGDAGYPEWCVNALRSVGVDLLEGNQDAKVVKGDGAKWEYSDTA
jgi:hypothetical protein